MAAKGRRKTNRQVIPREAKRTIPFESKKFWIEVAWIISTGENGKEEEEWTPSESGRKISRDTVEWWPALVQLDDGKTNPYVLFCSTSSSSSSQKDLNVHDKHWIYFEDDEWLTHTGGCEKGNLMAHLSPAVLLRNF